MTKQQLAAASARTGRTVIKAIEFQNVAVGQTVIFDLDFPLPTVYTKTLPFVVKGRGRNVQQGISELQYGTRGKYQRQQRAFCNDPERVVYLVEESEQ